MNLIIGIYIYAWLCVSNNGIRQELHRDDGAHGAHSSSGARDRQAAPHVQVNVQQEIYSEDPQASEVQEEEGTFQHGDVLY